MTESVADRVGRLIARATALLTSASASEGPIGAEIRRVLGLLSPVPPLVGTFPNSRHPVVALVGDAARQGSTESAALREEIVTVAAYLPWEYNYPTRPDAPDLGSRMAFAELVGPAAPFRSDSVCLGFTLIAPETLYPEHHHPATELYYVIAGTSTWVRSGVALRRAPGTFILHPSQAPHAMQTGAEPLLALYTWTGSDVRTTSAYCGP